MLVAVLTMVYGLKHLADGGDFWVAALCVVAGVLTGVAFMQRQRRLSNPLMDLALFSQPGLKAGLGINLLCFLVPFANFLLTSQYLQGVLGMQPLQAGWWSVPGALGFVAGSLLAPQLLRWVEPARVITGGLALACLGFALLTQVGGDSALAVLVTGSVIFSLGLSPVATLITDLITSAAPPARAGSAASISETSFELGGALGIALLGSLVSAFYRSAMLEAPLPGVPADLAGVARATLGGAQAAAAQLGGDGGEAVLQAARNAFAGGFRLAAGISAALMLLTAVLSANLLSAPLHTAMRNEPAE